MYDFGKARICNVVKQINMDTAGFSNGGKINKFQSKYFTDHA